MRRHIARALIGGLLGGFIVAGAQAAPRPTIQSPEEALTQDAAEYARRRSVSLDEAKRRLRAQEDSVIVTDRLRTALGNRLAGISIEHHPQYRIRVLLTGM